MNDREADKLYMRVREFQEVWDANKSLYRNGNQKYYAHQLRDEAEKVRHLKHPIDCYNEKCLRLIGNIGEKTASMMGDLLDEEMRWSPPKQLNAALFLTLKY